MEINYMPYLDCIVWRKKRKLWSLTAEFSINIWIHTSCSRALHCKFIIFALQRAWQNSTIALCRAWRKFCSKPPHNAKDRCVPNTFVPVQVVEGIKQKEYIAHNIGGASTSAQLRFQLQWNEVAAIAREMYPFKFVCETCKNEKIKKLYKSMLPTSVEGKGNR